MATAPGAGGIVVRIPPEQLPPGRYLVRAQVGYGVKPGVESNMELRRDGKSILRLDCPQVSEYTAPWVEVRLRLDGTQDLSVNAITVAAAGQIYKASLVARLE